MPIKIKRGTDIYKIENGFPLTFDQLLNNIYQHFGPVSNLHNTITYTNDQKVVFIIDDATLKLAQNTFHQELSLTILTDEKKIGNHHSIHCQEYNNIKGTSSGWN
jgi:glycerol dehydrogenase-like iron-containing ADH family enzyme